MKLSYSASKKLEEFLVKINDTTIETVFPELNILTQRNYYAEIVGSFVNENIEVEIPDKALDRISFLIETYGAA